jgi:hypothetical protein
MDGSDARIALLVAAVIVAACNDPSEEPEGPASSTAPLDPQEDPCEGDGCFAPPLCGEACPIAGCCCACSGSLCDITADGRDAVARCPGGWCYELEPCAANDVCTYTNAPQTEATCVQDIDDCDLLLDAYEAVARGFAPYCGGASECAVVAGHCDLGLGECWYAASATQVESATTLLQALANRWVALDCAESPPTCDCPPSATPTCAPEGEFAGNMLCTAS